MNTTKITVQASIAAESRKAWDYYTNPEHITKWNFASPEWHCPKAENNMQVGGKYSSRMEAKDGSWGFDLEAIYDEINEGQNFTYSFDDGRQARVDFENRGDITNVLVVFDAESANPIDIQKQGWQAILDNFKNYVEAN